MNPVVEPPAEPARASSFSDGGAVPPPHKRTFRAPTTNHPPRIAQPSALVIASPDYNDTPASSDLTARLLLLRYAIGALLLFLLIAIGRHQLVRSQEHTAAAQRQSHRRILMPAPRGIIYDREHRVLAGNKLRTDATINIGLLRPEFAAEERRLRTSPDSAHTSIATSARARLTVLQKHLDRLNALTGRQARLDAAFIERHFARNRLTPFVLLENLTPAEVTRLTTALTNSQSSSDVFPLIQLTQSSHRVYPHNNTAAHVLGRVRNELIRPPARDDFATLNYHETTGDFGLEKQFDATLRGRPSKTILRLDASGFTAGAALAHSDAIPGQSVVTSLDLDLQLAAEKAMDSTPGSRGGAVAIAIKTGEVLVLASKPDFDLNAVLPPLFANTKHRIDAEGGWLNRATQGLYPPGSSFKIFTMLAGLRGDTLQPDTSYRCDGFLQIGNHRFPCHHAEGHGALTLATALPHSCNVFAFRTGLATGPSALAAEARRFHFDESTGIDLPSETTRSLVPDPSWKTNDNRGLWTDGDTANLAIGQGFLRISPLQAACAMASLARRETLTVPTLLHQPNRRPSGERAAEPLAISDTAYTALVASLRAVVETGIGSEAQVPGIKIAGKTGTAQVETPRGMMNIAWFIAFAPAENPEIALAVAMEGGEPGVEFAGARYAAPVAREILGAYFDKHTVR